MRYKKALLLSIASLVCTTLAAVDANAEKPAQVTVTNTPSQPVPVSGTVNVGNSVLPVEISNANPVTVTVAGQGQQYGVWVTFDNGGCGVNCFNFLRNTFPLIIDVIQVDLAPVPAGKRWVITKVDAKLPTHSAQTEFAFLSQRSASGGQPGGTTFANLKAMFHGPYFNFDGDFTFSADMLTSYGPGETPHVIMRTIDLFDANGGHLTINGYLVDEP